MDIKFSGTIEQIKAEISTFLAGVEVRDAEAPKERASKGRKSVAGNTNPEPTPAPVPAPVETPPPQVEIAIPTEKEVQDATVAVNAKFGIDKAIECLTKFGVKRARELAENQRADYIAHCNEVLK